MEFGYEIKIKIRIRIQIKIEIKIEIKIVPRPSLPPAKVNKVRRIDMLKKSSDHT